jgi:hypothetical protein
MSDQPGTTRAAAGARRGSRATKGISKGSTSSPPDVLPEVEDAPVVEPSEVVWVFELPVPSVSVSVSVSAEEVDEGVASESLLSVAPEVSELALEVGAEVCAEPTEEADPEDDEVVLEPVSPVCAEPAGSSPQPARSVAPRARWARDEPEGVFIAAEDSPRGPAAAAKLRAQA